jgi:hypothetical protein
MAPKDPEKRLRELKSQKGTALNAAPAPNGLAGGALALRGAQRPFDTLYTTTPAPEIPGKFPKISVFGAGRGRNPTPYAYIPTINQLRSSALAQDTIWNLFQGLLHSYSPIFAFYRFGAEVSLW